MRTQLLNGVQTAILLLAISGCGGGGGGGSVGGGSLTPQQRYAAIDAVNAKLDSLAGLDQTAQNQQVLAFIKSRPEFKAAQLSDDGGSVWATFTDDEPYVVINNLHIAPQSRAGTPSFLQRGGRAAQNLPSQTHVRLFDALSQCATTPTAQLQTMLAGYTVQTGTGTIAQLKAVNGEDGLFYMNTHGSYSADGVTLITTDDLAGPQGDANFADDLLPADHTPRRLVRSTVRRYDPSNNTCHSLSAYSFTPAFVRKYMSFGPNSLVIIQACLGRHLTDLRDACFAQGASVFAGWTPTIWDIDGTETTLFLVDRLIGANNYEVPDPPQRSFDYVAVAGDMHVGLRKNGKSYGLDYSDPGDEPAGYFVMEANPGTGKGDFGLLAPSIEHMEMAAVGDNSTELKIFGSFGSKQGTVSITGVDRPVKSGGWTPQMIRCTLPAHDEAGAYGDVVVDVDGRKSNKVQLTMWEITFTHTEVWNFSRKYIWMQPQPPDFTTYFADPTGSATVKIVFKLYPRADIHESRSQPDQKPPFNQPVRNFLISENGWKTHDGDITAVTVFGSASTTITNDKNSNTDTYNNTFSVEGASSVALDGSDSRASLGSIYGGVDMAKREMGVVYSVFLDPIVHIDSSPPGFGMVPTNSGIAQPNVKFPLQADGNISQGSSQTFDSGRGFTRTLTVDWSGKVLAPPDPNGARSTTLKRQRRG